jgi:uncharacterized protein
MQPSCSQRTVPAALPRGGLPARVDAGSGFAIFAAAIGHGGGVTSTSTDFGFLLTLQPGDEVVRCLIQFARAQEVDAAVVSGIGSISEAELGAGGSRGREHRRRTVAEPLEACSITGTVTLVDGEPFPHLHGTFARADHSLLGGHVYQAVCATSVELAIQVTAEPLPPPVQSQLMAAGQTT